MSKPPLWEMMKAAYDCSTAADGSTDNWTDGDGYAAEIRAVRDWLVPRWREDQEIPRYLRGSEYHVREIERQALRALLTAEADRAERGEGGPAR